MREELLNRIVETVKEKIGEEYEVCLKKVQKNNGIKLQALMILKQGVNLSPAIYVDCLLEKISSSEIGIQEAAQEIISIYQRHQNYGSLVDVVKRINKQSILANVTYQIINAEKNMNRLCNMPHRKFLDLAVIYRMKVGEDEFGISSFAISNEHCKMYGLEESELYSAARQNTEKNGFQIHSMESFIAEIMGMPEKDVKSVCHMWVITNVKSVYGAAVMLYTEYFDRLAQRIEGNLYVLPSSINEVIVLPDNIMEPDELKKMVSIVNFRQIPEDEVLSGNVYRYIREENKLVIA